MGPSEPFVIHEQECDPERWAELARGPVHWRTLVSADQAPTDSITLGVAELEPGGEGALRWHRHAPPEVYYVLSGAGTVRIDEEAYRVRAGTAVFVPGDAGHEVRNDGPETLRLLYVFPVDSRAHVLYEFPGHPDAPEGE